MEKGHHAATAKGLTLLRANLLPKKTKWTQQTQQTKSLYYPASGGYHKQLSVHRLRVHAINAANS